MQHETTPTDNQVKLPELPEWNGELMTESEFAEAAQAYALEAVRMNQPASGEAVAWQYRIRAEDIDPDMRAVGLLRLVTALEASLGQEKANGS